MRLVPFLTAALAASGCAPRAARIPAKAAEDMQCPKDQISVMEVESQGDSGPHWAMGCGKKVVYELDSRGEWVVNAPILKDPQHIKPQVDDR